MKEDTLINLLNLAKRHIYYSDGFWLYKDDEENITITDAEFVREFIRNQGIPILERDITNALDELTHNRIDFDLDEFVRQKIRSRGEYGKSKYFASLDKLYPGNKFRQIMNYYLFSEDCFCFVFIGYGQTGKTTFVNVISKIIGEALFGRSNVAMLKGSHGTALLEGKKLFEVAEAQDLDLDTANLLKSMITNDAITINPKFEHPRTIIPHVKMIMTCNNMPHFKVTDDGIIRRFIIMEMDNKIKTQNKHFMEEIEEDIPHIIWEAMLNPFHIEDFGKERYYIFEHDPQYGFGYGNKNEEFNITKMTTYENYREMCRAYGYLSRNKTNFDKFIKLALKYGEEAKKCVTTSSVVVEENGLELSNSSEEEEYPF